MPRREWLVSSIQLSIVRVASDRMMQIGIKEFRSALNGLGERGSVFYFQPFCYISQFWCTSSEFARRILTRLWQGFAREALRISVGASRQQGRIGTACGAVQPFPGALAVSAKQVTRTDPHPRWLLLVLGQTRCDHPCCPAAVSLCVEHGYRPSRNSRCGRAMASLQKVTDVKKKGLMRWMHVRSVRILKVWKTYAQSRRMMLI
jgi:hypothetical protein